MTLGHSSPGTLHLPQPQHRVMGQWLHKGGGNAWKGHKLHIFTGPWEDSKS